MKINPPGFRVFALIAVGFALKLLSGRLELAGDLSAAVEVRLGYHLTALALLMAAFICFGWAFKIIFFGKPKVSSTEQPPALKRPDPVVPDAETFDPDAAIARYMTRRGSPGPGDVPVAKPGGFGRKRI
jgi:hypothetical protein